MDKQKENFERLVCSHKDTIYTVCYMFSKDENEVADLFQETLIKVQWKSTGDIFFVSYYFVSLHYEHT